MSERSPETGAEPSAKDRGGGEARTPGPLEVELEVSRQHVAGWTLFGILFGALLVWKLGTVAVWVGVLLIVYGAFNAWELVQTFVHAPGTIVVNDTQVILPRGLCMSRPIKVSPSDVTAVYFLRRSVPWNRSAPVLVIEVGDKAMAFPRDWFASEADQRHIVHALMPSGSLAAAGTTDATREKVSIDDTSRTGWIQMAAGVVLMGVGVAAFVMSTAEVSDGGHYALFVAPIVAGFLLLWRGFSRW